MLAEQGFRPRPALSRAPDAGTVGRVVQRIPHLPLDQFALFLDHHDQPQALRPVGQAFGVHGPGLRHLPAGNAKAHRLRVVDPEQPQRLHDIEPGLARRDDADGRSRRADAAPVHPVRAGKGDGRGPLPQGHPRLLRHGVVDKADVQPVLGQHEVGADEGHPVGAPVHHGGGLDRVLHQLEPGPEAREPRQGKAVQAKVEDLLHTSGRQDGHGRIDAGEVGLVQAGGRFARVIVPQRHDDPAHGRSPRHARVPHHVTRPVDTGALAIPQREHAVEPALPPQMRGLRSPAGGCGQVFIQSRLEPDVGRPQHTCGAGQCHVDTAEGRTPIARDIARGVAACRAVPRLLRQHQPHQCLRPGQQDGGFRQVEPVGQRDLLQHSPTPPISRVSREV